jgi:hypothetical protein
LNTNRWSDSKEKKTYILPITLNAESTTSPGMHMKSTRFPKTGHRLAIEEGQIYPNENTRTNSV